MDTRKKLNEFGATKGWDIIGYEEAIEFAEWYRNQPDDEYTGREPENDIDLSLFNLAKIKKTRSRFTLTKKIDKENERLGFASVTVLIDYNDGTFSIIPSNKPENSGFNFISGRGEYSERLWNTMGELISEAAVFAKREIDAENDDELPF